MICPISRSFSLKTSFVDPPDRGVSSQIPRLSPMDTTRDQDSIIYSLESISHHSCHLRVTILMIPFHSDRVSSHHTSSILGTISRCYARSHPSRSTSSISTRRSSPIAITPRSGEMRTRSGHSVIYSKMVCHRISPGSMLDSTR